MGARCSIQDQVKKGGRERGGGRGENEKLHFLGDRSMQEGLWLTYERGFGLLGRARPVSCASALIPSEPRPASGNIGSAQCSCTNLPVVVVVMCHLEG